jgi:hypothetical protein
MADEQPSLHIDTDWKKQAQEEKRRLAEKAQQEEQARAAAASVTPAPSLAGGLAGAPASDVPGAPGAASPASARAGRGARGRERRDLPPASIATLAQSLMTQTLYYLGDVAYQGGDPVANLDMAKHNIDTLAVIEEKTGDKLTDEERHALDLALHESRSRFVSVASQFI